MSKHVSLKDLSAEQRNKIATLLKRLADQKEEKQYYKKNFEQLKVKYQALQEKYESQLTKKNTENYLIRQQLQNSIKFIEMTNQIHEKRRQNIMSARKNIQIDKKNNYSPNTHGLNSKRKQIEKLKSDIQRISTSKVKFPNQKKQQKIKIPPMKKKKNDYSQLDYQSPIQKNNSQTQKDSFLEEKKIQRNLFQDKFNKTNSQILKFNQQCIQQIRNIGQLRDKLKKYRQTNIVVKNNIMQISNPNINKSNNQYTSKIYDQNLLQLIESLDY